MANQESQGIKLFGQTITLLGSQATKSEEHQQIINNSSNNNVKSDPTVVKRPDKIIPCPRCKSMETKFCYFNNYNVNQPRHFCKGCQRYWTAGGALRNVPVGAGRRKNKPPGHGNGPVEPSTGLTEIYGLGGAHKIELVESLLAEEWQAAAAAMAAHSGLRHGFQVKRPRYYSDGQSC